MLKLPLGWEGKIILKDSALFVGVEPVASGLMVRIYPTEVEKPFKKTLHLTLYRKWFDDIYAGRKRKEFRAWTPYWNKRLLKYKYEEVLFRNGYGAGRPYMRLQLTSISLFLGGTPVFVICLGDILEIGNYKPTEGL